MLKIHHFCYNQHMRLDRLLANSGYGTRSQVKDLLRAGHVRLDSEVIKDPGIAVSETDAARITVNDEPISASKYLYYVLNKPDACITAMEDSHNPCVGDLLPTVLRSKKLSPVGRLDFHTTGVLLITNDGELSHRLTGPKWHAPKVYLVTYEGKSLDDDDVALFQKGLVIHENGKPNTVFKPATLELLSETQCRLTLYEGKTHQVKRMLAARGRSVVLLHRESMGPIMLAPNQPLGELRRLNEEEVALLRDSCQLFE